LERIVDVLPAEILPTIRLPSKDTFEVHDSCPSLFKILIVRPYRAFGLQRVMSDDHAPLYPWDACLHPTCGNPIFHRTRQGSAAATHTAAFGIQNVGQIFPEGWMSARTSTPAKELPEDVDFSLAYM
jgi:hypothetical protein